MSGKGITDKAKGKAKEVAGKATDDKSMKAEGIFDQVVGKTKDIAADIKGATEEVVDKAKDVIEEHKENKK